MKPAVSLFEFMPYGAPELLQSRQERMARALVISSALAVVLCAAAGTFARLITSAPVILRPPIHVTIIPEPPPPLNASLLPKIASPTSTIAIPAVPLPVPDVAAPKDQMVTAPGDVLKAASQPTGGDGGTTIQAPPGDTLPILGDYRFVEELPEAITRIKPNYPDLAREAGVEGSVVVNVLVGKDGRVIDVRLDEKHQVPMLNEAALAAARLWVFKPALNNNLPVAVWTAIPFVFHLH